MQYEVEFRFRYFQSMSSVTLVIATNHDDTKSSTVVDSLSVATSEKKTI